VACYSVGHGTQLVRVLKGTCRRHLKLRTEGRRSRVHELGSVQLFNVTSAYMVRFLPNFVHIIIQVYGDKGSEFGNDIIYIYNFTKHDTLLSSDFTCISGTDYFT